MSPLLPSAWIVESDKRQPAVFVDLPRAEKYVSDTHGSLLSDLYKLSPEQRAWLAQMPPQQGGER